MRSGVVVTGLGVVAPNGLGVSDFWGAVCAGRGGVGVVSRFDVGGYPARLAGEVSGFDAGEFLPGRLLAQTDRVTQLALVAAGEALGDAGVEVAGVCGYRLGVVTASCCGGFEFGANELRNLWSKGGRYVSAYQSFAWFYAVNTGQISIRHGMRGPSSVLVGDQAGGLDALAHARRLARDGTVMLAGGVEAPLCPWGWVAQLAGGRLAAGSDPERGYLPFDVRAAGHVPGEGGALLVVEDAAVAARRGARVYGAVSGWGATLDPRPGSGRPSTLPTAIQIALDDAGLVPADVDVVFADAAAVPELDRVEAAAITDVFGPGGVPVTAPKTMTGRLGAGAGPLDVVTALLTLNSGLIPPTINTIPDPGHRLDLVTAPRTAPARTALVLARGHGGFNTALILQTTT
ncbi:ketosynthase chain-length factor [Spirillospora sp. NPDC048911]|uniref:ketosynthase chain-length factor n=1 Tax=Spirillospora sp. NPDC048911 TaxID=3364527 RepID=UPI00371BBB69